MRGDFVAEPGDGIDREIVSCALDLLQAQHIRPCGAQPIDQARQPGGDGVDVPGRNPHGPSVSHSPGSIVEALDGAPAPRQARESNRIQQRTEPLSHMST
jgi:hypothetical protein